MQVWGYSGLADLLKARPSITNGVIIDTNILVSATYELDDYYEDSLSLIDQLIKNNVPIFGNVNIRSEFLEIHRRIIFSEAILDFERQCVKSDFPPTLSSLLTTYRSGYERQLKNKPFAPPRGLGERELKKFRLEMALLKRDKKDVWTELCEDRIGNKLSEIWANTESGLALNFLTLRKEDREKYLNYTPDWKDAVTIMETHGLASSDAMIMNMFLASKLEVIASSDTDIALSIRKYSNPEKCCIVPDSIKMKIS